MRRRRRFRPARRSERWPSSWAAAPGTRLFPLTKDRAKPAVPLGGKYRLVDIPISNCLNSGLRSIYVLTQFNSMSLHRHIQASYKFDNFSRSFVDILAAQQTPEGSQWYQGTADAVRQNMRYFLERPLRLLPHPERRPALPNGFPRAAAPAHPFRRGHHAGDQAGRRASRFPSSASCKAGWTGGSRGSSRSRRTRALLSEMQMSRELLGSIGSRRGRGAFQASMGIYVFNRDVLVRMPGQRSGRFRQAHHPAIDQGAASQRLHFQGLLGGHRNDPRLLRGEPRSDRYRARIQFLRRRQRRSTRTRDFFPAARSTARLCARRSFPTAASFPMRTSSAA